MNPSQPQHCIGNVRSHVRFSRAEHISQSKHKDQNVPQRRGNEGHSNSTRNTAKKKKKKKTSTAGKAQRMDGLGSRVRRESFSSPLGGATADEPIPARTLSQYLAEIGPGGPRNALGAPRPHRSLTWHSPSSSPKPDLQAREP